jgi:hypothetical protein
MSLGNNFITPDNIRGQKITAFFTTRKIGRDVNMIATKLQRRNVDCFLPTQKHTCHVHHVENSLDPQIADAAVTARKNLLIGVLVADCAPILLYDPINHIAAAVHAGWRGTACGIIKNTLDMMEAKLHVDLSQTLMAIGPCIGPCCYEVGYEVISAIDKTVEGRRCYEMKEGRFYLNLTEANRFIAQSVGVRPENIWVSGHCTRCQPDDFHSYRRDRELAGRQGGFIILL